MQLRFKTTNGKILSMLKLQSCNTNTDSVDSGYSNEVPCNFIDNNSNATTLSSDFWNAIKPHYYYIMNENLIDRCQSSENVSDKQEATKQLQLEKFFEKFFELRDWIEDKKTEISTLSKNTVDLMLYIGSEREMKQKAKNFLLLEEFGNCIASIYPEFEKDIHNKLVELNMRWKNLELSADVNGTDRNWKVHQDIETKIKEFNEWLHFISDSMEAPLTYLESSSTAGMQQRLKLHTERQKEIESQVYFINTLKKLIDSNINDDEEQDWKYIFRTMRKVQKRWKEVWLRSLEIQCFLERELAKLKAKSVHDGFVVDEETCLTENSASSESDLSNCDVIPFEEEEYEKITSIGNSCNFHFKAVSDTCLATPNVRQTMSVCSVDSLDRSADHVRKCASFNAILSYYENMPSPVLNNETFNAIDSHLYSYCDSNPKERGVTLNNAYYSKDEGGLYAESHCLMKVLDANQLIRCKSDIINGQNTSDSSGISQQRPLHNYTDKIRSHIKVVKIRIPGKNKASRYSYDGSAESSDISDSSKISSPPTESVLSSAQKDHVAVLGEENISDRPAVNAHHYSEDDTMYNVSFTQSDLSDWGKKGKANNSCRHIVLKASDSDVDDFQNLLDDTSQQYRSIKSWLNDMSSAESGRKNRFSTSEVMATCQFNIKCLKEVRMNFENQSVFNGISLNQLDELIERWKMLESEINEKFKENKLLSKTLEELSKFQKDIDDDFKRVYEKNFRTPEELSARIDELEKYRIVLSEYKAQAESFITRLVRPFNEITDEELSIVRVSVKGLAKFIDKLAVNLRLVTHQMCNGLYRWNCFNGTLEKLKHLMNECVQETIAREENRCQFDTSSKYLAVAAIQSRFKDFDFIETNLACIKSLLPDISTFCSEETHHELLGEVIYMKRRKDIISAWSSDLIDSLKNDDTSVSNSSRRMLYYRTLLSCLSAKNKDGSADNSVPRYDDTLIGKASVMPDYNLNECFNEGGKNEMIYRFSDGTDIYRNYNYDFYKMDSNTHPSSSFKIYANTNYVNSDMRSLSSTYFTENKAVLDDLDKKTAAEQNDLQKENSLEVSEDYTFHKLSSENVKTNDFTSFIETSKIFKSEEGLYDNTDHCEINLSKYENDICKHDFEPERKNDFSDKQRVARDNTSSVSESAKGSVPPCLSTTSEELVKSVSSNYVFENEPYQTGRISSESISKTTSLFKHGDSGYQDSAGSFCGLDTSLNSTNLASKCYLRKHKENFNNSKHNSEKHSLAVFKKGDKNASTCKRDIEYDQKKRAFANSKAKRFSRANSSLKPTFECICPFKCYQANEEHNEDILKDQGSVTISEHTKDTAKWWKHFICFLILAAILFICLTWNRSNYCDYIAKNHFWSNCKYPSRFPPT